jgi:hypothetical protein
VGTTTRRVSTANLVRQKRERDGLDAKNQRIVAATPQRAHAPQRGRTILALDPGGHTGVALRLPDAKILTNTVTAPSDLFDFFIEKPDIVVFEIFATGGRVDRHMIYTIELVGAIKALCYILGIKAYAHVPQARNPWIEAAATLLKGTAHTRHEIDACAHLLAFEELGR